MKPTITCLLFTVFVTACAPRMGWQYNDKPYPANVAPIKGKAKKTLKDFEYIPGGTFVSERIEGFDTFLTLYSPSRVTISSFYIQKYEVTVGEYMEFYRKTGDPANLPDTAAFDDVYWFSGQESYFTHPDFSNHPVVGVNREQVIRYITWKEAQINDALNDGPYAIRFRLPTEKELEYVSSRQEPKEPLPDQIKRRKEMDHWHTGPTYSREGMLLSKFDGYYGLAPVDAMRPDGSGLYHIRGNAAEWTLDRVSERFDGMYDPDAFLNEYYTYSYMEPPYRDFFWLNDTCLFISFRDTAIAVDTQCFCKRVADVIRDTGYYVTTGGSWLHSVFYAQPGAFLPVHASDSHSWLGFRMVMYVYRKTDP